MSYLFHEYCLVFLDSSVHIRNVLGLIRICPKAHLLHAGKVNQPRKESKRGLHPLQAFSPPGMA